MQTLEQSNFSQAELFGKRLLVMSASNKLSYFSLLGASAIIGISLAVGTSLNNQDDGDVVGLSYCVFLGLTFLLQILDRSKLAKYNGMIRVNPLPAYQGRTYIALIILNALVLFAIVAALIN